MELLKLLSLNEIVAQVVSFLLLLALLRVFAWNKILKLLDDRRDRIALEFRKIEEAKNEAAKSRLEYEEKISRIHEERKRIIQEALSEGKAITDEVRKKANLEAQEIIASAKDNIKYELAAAKEELKEKIVDLTILSTEHIIQEKFTEEDDKKLIRDFLEKAGNL